MEEIERIDYLINALSGGNAKNFALKAGIRPDSLSRTRHGRGNPSSYFERILDAFPDVRREWLYFGIGKPLSSEVERSEVLERLIDLEKEVKKLTEMIEKYQESTNSK